jgi:hypothetical protein
MRFLFLDGVPAALPLSTSVFHSWHKMWQLGLHLLHQETLRSEQ